MDEPTPVRCLSDTDKSLDFAPADLTDYRPQVTGGLDTIRKPSEISGLKPPTYYS